MSATPTAVAVDFKKRVLESMTKPRTRLLMHVYMYAFFLIIKKSIYGIVEVEPSVSDISIDVI